MENQQPTVRLNFTCNRNWEDMTAVEGGRFCTDCQKKVVDFTDKTPDEIIVYLTNSTTQVCGKFTASQLNSSPTKTFWKRWLSAAAVFAVFIGIKEASAQNKTLQDTINNHKITNANKVYALGEVYIPPTPETIFNFQNVDIFPSFPGGDKAFIRYWNENLHQIKGTQGRVIASFIVEKDGSLTDIKTLRWPNKEAAEEALRFLKASPKWNPGSKNGILVRTAYTMPIIFGQ